MSFTFEIEETDEEVYILDNLEVCFEKEYQFIVQVEPSGQDIFIFNTLSDFIQKGDKFYLTNKDKTDISVLELSLDQYNVIKSLLEKKAL